MHVLRVMMSVSFHHFSYFPPSHFPLRNLKFLHSSLTPHPATPIIYHHPLIRENILHVGLGSDILNKTPKAQEIKARINKWDELKLKSFFSTKNTINNMKREPTEWEKIFSTHTSDLISRIYKELTKHYTKNTKNPINKWAKELDRRRHTGD